MHCFGCFTKLRADNQSGYCSLCYDQKYSWERRRVLAIEKKDRYFTKNGHIHFIYRGTKRYWGKSVQFTESELINFSNSDASNYLKLFREWEASKFKLGLTPMISKFLLKQPYSLGNVYWTTFEQTGVEQQRLMQRDMDNYLKRMKDIEEAVIAKRKKKKAKDKENVQTEPSR